MNHRPAFSEEMWTAIRASLEAENYANAIRDAFLYMSNVIRDKGDCDGDGDKLIGEAFGGDKPKIQINQMETESQRREQQGFSQLLRGLYLAIRNPRSHELLSDTEADAYRIIGFLDWVCARIHGSRGSYTIDEFVAAVEDSDFVESADYANALWGLVPKRKRYDYAVALLRARERIDVKSLKPIFDAWFAMQDDTAVEAMLALMSDALRVTTEDNDRRDIVALIHGDMWTKIDAVSRLRTEKRIVRSIAEGKINSSDKVVSGYFCTWCTHLFPFLSDIRQVQSAIGQKVIHGNLDDLRFASRFLLPHAWSLFDEDQLDSMRKADDDVPFWNSWEFPLHIRSQIEDGSKYHYDLVVRARYKMPPEIWEFFSRAVGSFEEREEASPSEPLSDFEDDVPF